MEQNSSIDTSTRIHQFAERMSPYVSTDVLHWLTEHGFFTAPASTKYHGCHEGGLFDHSYLVAKTLCDLTVANNLKWERPESPLIVGMFHDVCKIDQYRHPKVAESVSFADKFDIYDENSWEYNPNTLFKGHGDKSVIMLASLMKLTEEEAACIRYHMGAFCDREQWNDYTRAVHMFSNVLWTHHADMIASHVHRV